MSNTTVNGPVPDPWLPAVNVTVPMSVANDLDKMQGAIREVMSQLGCPTCHSGRDLRITIARDFVVDPDGQVQQAVTRPLHR
jgi:predicted TPR repeat methyltransferase